MTNKRKQDVGSKVYRPWPDSAAGYRIEKGPDGWRWVWTEPGEDADFGIYQDSEAAAFRDAAEDWESNGGHFSSRLAGMLKACATRLEKVGTNP